MEFEQPIYNFEQEGRQPDDDETSINLRAYFDRLATARLLAYDPAWTDAQLAEWDGNFKDDGALLLPCTERDVTISEYRDVLNRAIAHRQIHEGRR